MTSPVWQGYNAIWWCARARKFQGRVCAPSHTHVRTQISHAPTAVDRHARSTCTTASVGLAHRRRLPVSSGKSTRACTSGQAYLNSPLAVVPGVLVPHSCCCALLPRSAVSVASRAAAASRSLSLSLSLADSLAQIEHE